MALSIFVEQIGDMHALRLKGQVDDQPGAALAKGIDSFFVLHHRNAPLDLTRFEGVFEKAMFT